MNRRGYEILSPYSAPTHRWQIIIIISSLITIIEIVMACFICRSAPDIFNHLRFYGSGQERILVSFFAASLANNVICSVVFHYARYRSAWNRRGVLIKCVVIWFAYRSLAFLIASVVHCTAYYNIENTFEHSDFLPVLKNYSTDWHARLTVTRMHRKYRCCGINGAFDFTTFKWHFEDMELDEFQFKVPKSCCLLSKCAFAAQNFDDLTVFRHGCYNRIMDDFEEMYRTRYILFIILTIIHASQFILILLSMPKVEKINMTYEEFVLNKNLFTVLYQKGLMQKIEKKIKDLSRAVKYINMEEIEKHSRALEKSINRELFEDEDEEDDEGDEKMDDGKKDQLEEEKEFYRSLSESSDSLSLFEERFPEKKAKIETKVRKDNLKNK